MTPCTVLESVLNQPCLRAQSLSLVPTSLVLLFQDESEEEYSSEDASDEEYEEELGSDESSGKDWSDLEREAAEDDADLEDVDGGGGGGGASRHRSKPKEKIRTKHR